MSTRAITSALTVSSLAATGAIVATSSPAAANSDPNCLGDFYGYQVHFVEPLRTRDGSATYGQTFLFFNPSNRCVYGKSSASEVATPGQYISATLEKTVDPNNPGAWHRTDECFAADNTYGCVTDKFTTADNLYAFAAGDAYKNGQYYSGRTPYY